MKMNAAEFERQYAEATRRGEERLRNQPLATSVRYDATRGVMIQLNNDCLVCMPLSLLPELTGASAKDLRRVEIMGVGQAIEWPTLDQQFDVLQLLADAVGASPSAEKVSLTPSTKTKVQRSRSKPSKSLTARTRKTTMMR